MARRKTKNPFGDLKDEDEDFDNMCGFCGATEKDGVVLIKGPIFNICNECVKVCCNILNGNPDPGQFEKPSQRAASVEAGARDFVKRLKVPTPRDIKQFLDMYVIGQEHAKKALSVAVHNHYRRITSAGEKDVEYAEVELDKSNILLIGPTGSGKTLFARTIARLLDVPFAIADATTLTEAGDVGDDVENILLSLIQAADGDIARAERGIIYIDEIDKIARKTENVSITRDVSGEGVQQALLKIIEGTVSRVPPNGGRKHPNQECLKINTENILFILGGAFVGLDAIISQRTGRKTVGFAEKKGEADEGFHMKVEPEDLVKYGLIPEFTGRIPVICSLSELTEEEMVRILTEPRNCLVKQYQKLFLMDGVKLSFDDGAIREIAREGLKRKTGARGMRAIMEQIMTELMFEAPGRKNVSDINITAELVKNQLRDPTTIVKFLK